MIHDNVLQFNKPVLTKSTFDLEFENEKLLFDVGFENEKIIFFWYRDSEDKEVVYEREVTLNKYDRIVGKLRGLDSNEVLKKKALSSIKKAINDFRKKVILQENMSQLVTEIMDAGQTNHCKA